MNDGDDDDDDLHDVRGSYHINIIHFVSRYAYNNWKKYVYDIRLFCFLRAEMCVLCPFYIGFSLLTFQQAEHTRVYFFTFERADTHTHAGK